MPSQDSAVVGRAIARLGCPVLTAKCHYRKAREKAWFASKASVGHLFMESKPSMMGFVTARMSKSRAKGEWQPRPFYPHSHLNLRHNPFGEASPEERVSLAVSDGGEVIELFLRPNSAIQVMGDHGRGKTSKLLALKRALLSEEGLDVEYHRLRDRLVIPKKIQVPKNAAKSFRLPNNQLRWFVVVDLDINNWPDAKKETIIVVR